MQLLLGMMMNIKHYKIGCCIIWIVFFTCSFRTFSIIKIPANLAYPPNSSDSLQVTGQLMGEKPILNKISAQGVLAPNYALIINFNDAELYQFFDKDDDRVDLSPETLYWYCFKQAELVTAKLQDLNPPTIESLISSGNAKALSSGGYNKGVNQLLVTSEIYNDSDCSSIGFTIQPKTQTGYPATNNVLIVPDYQLIARIDKNGTPAYESVEMIPLENATEIPFQSNSYLTSPEDKEGQMTPSGVLNWSAENYIYTHFIYAKSAGKLPIYLKYSVAKDATVRVSYQKTDFFVTLHADKNIAYVGTIDIEEEGYVELQFEGIAKKGSYFGAISSILVPNDLSSNLIFDPNYQRTLKVNGLSMGYNKPTTDKYEWFYAEATMGENGDAPHTYFAVLQMPNAYTGIQVNNTTKERRFLFSVWSPYVTDNPAEIPPEYQVLALKVGEGITTNDFGYEGSGFQSYIRQPWVSGQLYAFLVRMKPESDNNTLYTVFYRPLNESKWQLMATVRRPFTNETLSSLGAFLEPYGSYLFDFKNRQSQVGNVWVATADQKWYPIVKVTTTDVNSPYRQDLQYKVIDNRFVMQQNGFIGPKIMPGHLTVIAGEPPNIDLNEMIANSLPEDYIAPGDTVGVRAVERDKIHPNFNWSSDPDNSFPTTAFNGADFRLYTPRPAKYYDWKFEPLENAQYINWDNETQKITFKVDQQIRSRADFPQGILRGKITATLNSAAAQQAWYTSELLNGTLVHEFAVNRWFYRDTIYAPYIPIGQAQNFCQDIGKDNNPAKRFNLANYSVVTDAVPDLVNIIETTSTSKAKLGILMGEWGDLSDWKSDLGAAGTGWPQPPYDYMLVSYGADNQIIYNVDGVDWSYNLRNSDGLLRPYKNAVGTPMCVVDL